MSDSRKNAFEVVWRVENLESWFRSRKDSLYSPEFLVESISNTRWKLSLSSSLHLGERYLGLTLHRDIEDNGPEFIALNYELSFLQRDESPLNSKTYTKKFASKSVSHELNVKEFEILQEKKEFILPENILTVRCKLWKACSTILEGRKCSILSAIGEKSITLSSTMNISYRLNENYVTVNFISPSSEISFISFRALEKDSKLYLERIEVECKCIDIYHCELFVLNAAGEWGFYFDNSPTLLTPNKLCNFISRSAYDYIVKACRKNNVLELELLITCFPVVKSNNIEYKFNNCNNVADESTDQVKVNTSKIERVKPSPGLPEYQNKPCDFENNTCNDDYECAGNMHLPPTTLKNDLTSLYNDRLFCDTKLKTDNETFAAHRNILSARSPVFKKMFSTEMKEKIGDCINITDISSDTIRRMLQFIYTDSTGPLEMQSAKDLYIASDKYDIVSLKQQCISFMKDNLCPSNVCEVLVLADMHQDKNLESAAQEFVLMYDKEVLGSKEWKSFMKEFGGIAAQVMYLKFMKE